MTREELDKVKERTRKSDELIQRIDSLESAVSELLTPTAYSSITVSLQRFPTIVGVLKDSTRDRQILKQMDNNLTLKIVNSIRAVIEDESKQLQIELSKL